MNKFYVYAYFRQNGVICYIGKGSGKRWQRHEELNTNPHLAAIIKKSGGQIPRVKIREALSEKEAFEIERILIKTVGRGKNGSLVNLTDGGDGPSGLKHSIKTKKIVGKLSENMWRDPVKRDAIIAAQKAGRDSEEYRAKRSAISKEIMSRKGIRERISATKTASYAADPSLRAKISVATTAAMADPRVKANTSAAQKKRNENPIEREKLRAAGKLGAAIRWSQPPVKGLC